ncbi:MAG: hypothetical protein ACK44F_16645 [Roseococcus sp.]
MAVRALAGPRRAGCHCRAARKPPARLKIVEDRIAAALRRERAAGQPLKAAFHAVSRRLGLSPGRVRAYRHREVKAADVRAAEVLAAHAAMRKSWTRCAPG